jgi:hypothetical protein
MLEDALASARQISDESSRRTELLVALALQLPGAQRAHLLEEALSEALRLDDVVAYVHALAALAPHLPKFRLAAALEKPLEFAVSSSGEGVLRILAPHLSEPLLRRALKKALAIEEEESRARTVATLAPHLSPRVAKQSAARRSSHHR